MQGSDGENCRWLALRFLSEWRLDDCRAKTEESLAAVVSHGNDSDVSYLQNSLHCRIDYAREER